MGKQYFLHPKINEKVVGSKVGSEARSIIQSYGSKDPDPDLHQNVTDPQHCSSGSLSLSLNI
jgi:hypothetical protein